MAVLPLLTCCCRQWACRSAVDVLLQPPSEEPYRRSPRACGPKRGINTSYPLFMAVKFLFCCSSLTDLAHLNSFGGIKIFISWTSVSIWVCVVLLRGACVCSCCVNSVTPSSYGQLPRSGIVFFFIGKCKMHSWFNTGPFLMKENMNYEESWAVWEYKAFQ